MSKNSCIHINLIKVEEDHEQGWSTFKCLDCGKLTSMDKHLCKLCGDLPVDDIIEHMLHFHILDVNRCVSQ